MQQTRQHILEILKDTGEATVDELVEALAGRTGDITAVTVRHHLEILRGDGLINAPKVRRRTTPGRPHHVYTLTDKALEYFPNNYQNLAEELLLELKNHLSDHEINVILEGVADQMSNVAIKADAPLPTRLTQVVEYLNQQGYSAHWEAGDPNGYLLITTNCPYHQLSATHGELCTMDFRMITNLLGGIVPRRVAHMAEGADRCAYLIPEESLIKKNTI